MSSEFQGLSNEYGGKLMILVGAVIIVILVLATVVFITVYSRLLDWLERRGP